MAQIPTPEYSESYRPDELFIQLAGALLKQIFPDTEKRFWPLGDQLFGGQKISYLRLRKLWGVIPIAKVDEPIFFLKRIGPTDAGDYQLRTYHFDPKQSLLSVENEYTTLTLMEEEVALKDGWTRTDFEAEARADLKLAQPSQLPCSAEEAMDFLNDLLLVSEARPS